MDKKTVYNSIGRRGFLARSLVATAGLLATSNSFGTDWVELPERIVSNSSTSQFDLMQKVRKYRKIDSHAHVGLSSDAPSVYVDLADRLNIEKLVISKPATRGNPSPSDIRENNDYVLKAVKEFPDRFIGQMTLNVNHQKESLEEIKRCIDHGMVGLKLYTQVKINNPLFYPIIEKFIDLKMIVLMHVGIGKARVELNAGEPSGVTIPSDFVDISKRYPEAMFQLAHLGGGIDWEDACKAVKDCSNVYVDVSGSNNEAEIINLALKYIGEDRLLFGCDGSYYQGVGHVLAAELSEGQRKKIFFDNYNNILRKSGNHVD
jgi:predicted TIM-barrel fold metal-dependent hydrolase